MKARAWLIALLVTAAFCAGGVVAVQKREAIQRQKKIKSQLQMKQKAWDEMKTSVLAQVRGFSGESGIVIEDLKSGWRLVHQPKRSFAAASIIKVPMMTACYQAAREGKLDLSQKITLRGSDKVSGSGFLKAKPNGTEMSVSQLIDWMITQSDNTATNILISHLGMDYFNRHFQREGLKGTHLSRKMMDFSRRKEGVENLITAENMAASLEKIYRGRAVDATVSKACMEMLKRQKLKDRIPAKLPKDVPVAHKTGLERGVCHDAGIILAPQGDILVCVLTQSRNPKRGSQPAKRFIAEVSAAAYRYKVSP